MPLLEVKDLVVRFDTSNGIVQAVNGISFSLEEGSIIGVVGESGCGKSVSMRSIMGILPEPPARIQQGEILFRGTNLLALREDEMRRKRGKDLAMIFQDAMTSLNPVLKIGLQITESLREHMGMGKAEARERARGLFEWVGIPGGDRRLDQYPHEFSGGMRQRAMIAMALACSPSLLIADEPTTALDVTIQLQITALVRRLQEETGMGVIWITHDLGVVARLVSHVLVMYAGRIVESAPVKKLYGQPSHPYTLGLLHSLPRLDTGRGAKLQSIPGQPPDQLALPQGCPFAERCSFTTNRCLEENPSLVKIGEGHTTACWQWKKVIES